MVEAAKWTIVATGLFLVVMVGVFSYQAGQHWGIDWCRAEILK